MKSIINNISYEITVNKSKFITELIKINNYENINGKINEIKNKYKDATHYCYAYIYNNYKRCSDDGEPGGTAGMPILNVLENNDLNFILCVVIRYFGGIKLGSGGLVRAYTKSVTNALINSELKDIEKGKIISIKFSYDNSKIVNNLLKDVTIINKIFDQDILYTISIKNKDYILIKDQIKLYCININEEKDIYI